MQDLYQIAVDFNRGDLTSGFAEIPGQRSDAGADLDHQIFLCDVRGGDDLLKHILVGQKVLTEAFSEIEIVSAHDF